MNRVKKQQCLIFHKENSIPVLSFLLFNRCPHSVNEVQVGGEECFFMIIATRCQSKSSLSVLCFESLELQLLSASLMAFHASISETSGKKK